jgi:hypothetical protein
MWGLGVIGAAIVVLLAVIAYALLSEEDGGPAAQLAEPTATATPTPVLSRTPLPTPSTQATQTSTMDDRCRQAQADVADAQADIMLYSLQRIRIRRGLLEATERRLEQALRDVSRYCH